MKNQYAESPPLCRCFATAYDGLIKVKGYGMDNQSGEVSLFVCGNCGQYWLRYFYEVEAFTASGRWYLGAITPQQHSALTVENARSTLEELDWYFYGGSYYEGRSGRTSGDILLNP